MAAGGETILLVDDEPSIRLLAAEVLEEQGYTVHQAAEGGSAMQILSSGVPLHLLITDLGLPGIQGRELANSGINLHPGLKVLFITGYMENAALRTDPVTPAMRLLTKPFPLSSLPVLVREMLDQ
jgi:CheY-like chemotaxis protein